MGSFRAGKLSPSSFQDTWSIAMESGSFVIPSPAWGDGFPAATGEVAVLIWEKETSIQNCHQCRVKMHLIYSSHPETQLQILVTVLLGVFKLTQTAKYTDRKDQSRQLQPVLVSKHIDYSETLLCSLVCVRSSSCDPAGCPQYLQMTTHLEKKTHLNSVVFYGL